MHKGQHGSSYENLGVISETTTLNHHNIEKSVTKLSVTIFIRQREICKIHNPIL